MSTFEIIVSVATLIGVIFNIWTSKWCVRRRIERKQSRIHAIENHEFLYRRQHPCSQSPYMEEKWKLQDDIEELRKDL